MDHIKNVARRLATAGYVALAPDLASPEGGTDRFSDPAAVTALLGRTPPARLVSMLNAAVGALQRRPDVAPDRAGAVVSGVAWPGDSRPAIPPSAPSSPSTGRTRPSKTSRRSAIRAVYGALDERIDAGIPEIRNALERAGIVHEIIIYPGADHALFNDTGPRYNARAAADAWARTRAWFAQHLAP